MVKNPLKRLKKLLRRYCHRKTLPSNNAPTVNYYDDGDVMMESNKHAIAVAAATAVVAESALAAAKAAAEVVRLTSNNNASHSNSMRRRRAYLDDYLAAVKIQSAFRGYLARRALKALKGLVKIQALVRGYLVRKQSAQMLRRLQAMVRVQARARSTRVLHTEPSYCSPGKETPYPRRHEIHGMTEKLQDSSVLERCGSNSSIKDSKASEKSNSATIWFDNWLEVGSSVTSSNMPKTPCADSDKNNDKILEIDSSKPDINPKKKNSNNLSKSLQHISSHDYYNHSFTASDYLSKYSPTDEHNPISGDVSSMKSLNFTASNSRRAIFGASRIGSMRRSPKTPSRDECSESNLNGYSTFASPSYMANTQSSRAKTRSQSLPRQRGCDTDKVGSVKRSLQAFWESKTSSKQRL